MRELTHEELLSLGYEILKTMVDVEFEDGRVKSLLKKPAPQWTMEDIKYNHYLFGLQLARDEAKAKGI